MADTPSVDAKLRFDLYEADPASGELRKDGVRIPLQERPFRALLILLRRHNEVVSREELRQDLWPADVFIDFDHGLNTVIRKIRMALNDSSEAPRFIETVGRRGYRFIVPVEAVAPGARVSPSFTASAVAAAAPAMERAVPRSSSPWPRIAGLGFLLLVALAVVGYVFRPLAPAPQVSNITQLTTSGGAWYLEPIFADSSRVYYQVVGTQLSDWQFHQFVLNGHADSSTAVPPQQFRIRGISADGSQFFAMAQGAEPSMWAVPAGAGAPRRIGSLVVDDFTFSHRGTQVAYSKDAGSDVEGLYVAAADTTGEKLVARAPSAAINHIRWSPDDRRIRYNVVTATTATIWEVTADGRDPHMVDLGSTGTPIDLDGDWTPDGRYYIFRSRRSGASDLWANIEITDWWRRPRRGPVQLTFGPLRYYQPVASPDSRHLYAIGVQPSGELVRYDAGRKEYVQFLDGRSVEPLRFSRDGKWIAYVSFPEGTLWRARADGSEPLQLTFAPLQVLNLEWAPDGKRITFDGRMPGKVLHAYVISAEGGNAQPFPAEQFSEAAPEWAPDGQSIYFGRAYASEDPANVALFRWDLKSAQSTRVPNSDGLFHPIWSPDGRRLAAVADVTGEVYLIDPATGTRTKLAEKTSWAKWSLDSRYLYYARPGFGILRVRVPDGKEEKVAAIPFRPITGNFSLAPDGSILLLREHGRYDIYSLALSPQ